MWVTVEPGNVHEGRFEAVQFDAAHTVWRWQVGDSMAGGAQHSGITMTHDEAWREAMAVAERAKGAEALAAARAEGEAAGYRRAIDEACVLLDEEQLRAWATSVSPRNDGFASGVRHAMFEVRALAPVEPVRKADELPGGTP